MRDHRIIHRRRADLTYAGSVDPPCVIHDDHDHLSVTILAQETSPIVSCFAAYTAKVFLFRTHFLRTHNEVKCTSTSCVACLTRPSWRTVFNRFKRSGKSSIASRQGTHAEGGLLARAAALRRESRGAVSTVRAAFGRGERAHPLQHRRARGARR